MESTFKTSAWTNVSEIELVYKSKIKPEDRPQITSSQDAYDIFRELWNDNTLDFMEESKILLLNRNNRVLGAMNLSTGGITHIVIDTRLILAAALKTSAIGIILSHSHPSGNVNPSTADKQLTENICSAAKLMEIKLLDHIIVTRDKYFSFADEGLL